MRLDSNIESKSLNNTYLNIIDIFIIYYVTYLFELLEVLSLQITNFIESTLNDVFVYKAGAFTNFFLT